MRVFSIICLMILVSLAAMPVFAQSNVGVDMPVIAEGSAAVVDNDLARAEDEALSVAKRNAVEQGIGVFVKSESIGENYQVIKQTILTRSEGYVSKWNKVEGSLKIEKIEGNQILHLKISAKVKLLSLVSDLSDIEEIYNSMQRPKVLVLISEKNINDTVTDLPTSTSAIMRVLAEKKFDVVDPEVVKTIMANDAKRAGIERGDTKAAAAIALEQGAEILLLGSAKSSEQKLPEEYGGGSAHSASALLNARLVYSDTAEVLFTAKQTTGKGASFTSAEEAGSKALDNAGSVLISSDTERFANQIVARWANEIQNGRTMRFVFHKISYADLSKIKSGLREIRGFAGMVGAEKFTGNTATINVKYKLDPEDCREKVSKMKIPGKNLEITRVSGNVTEITAGK